MNSISLRNHSSLTRYSFAIIGLLCTVFAQYAMQTYLGSLTYFLIYPFVFLTISIAGAGPAIISIILGALFAGLVFSQADINLLNFNTVSIVRFILFCLLTGVTSWVIHFNQRNERKKDEKKFAKTLATKEEKFRVIFNTLPEIAWTARPDGHIDFYNDRWYEYTGFKRNKLSSVGWENIIHPDDINRCLDTWYASVKTGIPFKVECRFKDNTNGGYRWFLGHALPIKDESGKIVQWLGTCTDIDEQKKTQEQMRKTLNSRDEFLSVASHELKTPLTSLKLQAQVFKRLIEKNDPKGYSKERVDSFCSQIDRQISRLTRLIEDMLDISRIRTGKLSINKEETNLATLIEEVVDRMKLQFTSVNIPVPTVYGEKTVIGRWDIFRIEQVVSNLLTNAIRYGRKKPISVKVELLSSGIARLAVKDNGIGIDKENITKIFDRFERVIDPSEVSGLGLGLFIAKQIVEAHNGKIYAESVLNEGSTFYVELPTDTKIRS